MNFALLFFPALVAALAHSPEIDNGVLQQFLSGTDFSVNAIDFDANGLPKGKCDALERPSITDEYPHLIEMLETAAKIPLDSEPVQRFIPPAYRTQAQLNTVKQVFTNVAGLLKDPSGFPDIPIHVTCDTQYHCESERYDVGSWTEVTRRMNFCLRFFQISTAKVIKCQKSDWLDLYDSKSRALIHEFMHVSQYGNKDDVTDKEGNSIYGAVKCSELANGKIKDTNPDLAFNNADNFAWLMLNYYYQVKCGYSIPL
ncbi:MAG: hypothetical protein Q9227_007622 [Pyrenula ochraceoflavens]